MPLAAVPKRMKVAVTQHGAQFVRPPPRCLVVSEVSRTSKTLKAREPNTTLAMIRSIGPKDGLEAMLAIQMCAIHAATISAARRLNFSENTIQQDSNGRLLNKLVRSFAAQIETLKKHRSAGEQNVRVTHTHQHVNVTAGQAVVGIRQGGAIG